ncbi:hypothetical protein [Altericroceibacterium endophyticum]|uniref:Uncharacterized protein n=1 Tax=Altericroceibacterium endophyticum TaxID=1808508 RepID=A0A6I4T597_9SPHN|nr:hypothetical protein [Altericroceibacterium endophyticum]MXO65090.1 hypothetical protein [Altericroceibacterium endophyticum]
MGLTHSVLNLPFPWLKRWEALQRPLLHLPRWGAAAVLILGIAACVYLAQGTLQQRMHEETRQAARSDEQIGDGDLYEAINERVAAGEGYYEAALAEQRANNYPTRPFVTVRPPTLAWGTSLWGLETWRFIMIGVLIVTILGWVGALSARASMPERIIAALLIFLFSAGAFYSRGGLFHELVSGLFIALAMGIYRPHRWWPSLIAAAIALSIRELALPFMLLWAAFALCEGKRREAMAVILVIMLFGIGMIFHAQAVFTHQLPGDIVSPGWDAFRGMSFFFATIVQFSPLKALNSTIAAVLAFLPMIGWLGLGGRLGLFATLFFSGYALMMALFARDQNTYWVMIVMSAYPAGLAFVPRAVADLLRAIIRPVAAGGAASVPPSAQLRP